MSASRDLDFFVDATYTAAEGGFDPFDLPVPEEMPSNWDPDYSGIGEYSDLDYRMLELTYGISIRVDDAARLHASLTTLDLHDDQPWVYGDQDGRLTIYSAGMSLGF